MSIRLNLITRCRNIAAELAELDATKLGGLPNTKDVDGGTTVDHQGYKKGLWDELDRLFKMLGISSLDQLDALEASEPQAFRVETYLDV